MPFTADEKNISHDFSYGNGNVGCGRLAEQHETPNREKNHFEEVIAANKSVEKWTGAKICHRRTRNQNLWAFPVILLLLDQSKVELSRLMQRKRPLLLRVGLRNPHPLPFLH